MDLKDRLNFGIAIAESDEPHKEFTRRVLQRILEKIYKGGSAIKSPLQAGTISLADIVRAIKHKRCLRTPDQDFGATYLEQILGTAIRDVIPIKHINKVRAILGLEKLPPSELVKHKAKQIQQEQTPPQS